MSRKIEGWRPIPGAEGFYSVSDFGRVRSESQAEKKIGRRYGRVLRPSRGRKGYLLFRLCVPGQKQKQVRVHRAVLLAFVGPCPEGMQANHKDGDKTNNRPGNLEYVTCKENIRHCWVNGRHTTEHAKGEANNLAKLTEEKVRKIRAMHPVKSLGQLAAEYGVTKQAIWHVVHRKTWKHVLA